MRYIVNIIGLADFGIELPPEGTPDIPSGRPASVVRSEILSGRIS